MQYLITEITNENPDIELKVASGSKLKVISHQARSHRHVGPRE